jgi:hypothetical protein
MRLLNLRIDHEGSTREDIMRFITWSFSGFIGFLKIVEILKKIDKVLFYYRLFQVVNFDTLLEMRKSLP